MEQRQHRPRPLLLIAVGGLPLTCVPPDEPVATDDGAESTSTNGAATSGTPVTGEAGTGETGAPSPPPEHPACISYYETLLGCYYDEPEEPAYWAHICDEYIDMGLANEGQACADAITAWYVCLSSLSCQLLGGHVPQCVEEAEANNAACPETWPEPPDDPYFP